MQRQDLQELHTPCFIVKTQELRENIQGFQQALQNTFASSILSYSVKTNSLPYILSVAGSEGCYAEVVSYDEYHLAEKIGFAPDHMVYNGPMKDKETFLKALSDGAYVNLETQREIAWLKEYSGEKTNTFPHIGIRLNIDLGALSPADAKEGEEKSRFGFCFENGEFQKAMDAVQSLGFVVNGIHVHRTSKTRSIDAYEAIGTYACHVMEACQLKPVFIDFGGGFFGNMPGKPDYQAYCETMKKSLGTYADATIIVEPGNGLIASPVDYMVSVIDHKKIGEDQIYVCDGSRIDIDPFFHKTQYQFEHLPVGDAETADCDYMAETQGESMLSGCTCLENDILMKLDNGVTLQVDDRLLFFNEGAYTSALTPDFIRCNPNVYAYDGQQYFLVREKWTEDSWMMGSQNLCMPQADTYLFTNAGRRATLMKNFKKSLGCSARIIATDNWCVAPAIYTADKYYLTPKITDESYVEQLLEICKQENVKAVTSLIDPEIAIMAENRERFLEIGTLPLCPSAQTAQLCFDKYRMFQYLKEEGINTVLTFDSLEHFEEARAKGEIDFPVFIKPRTGSGSVGAERINTEEELKDRFAAGKHDYIIQELMDCDDCDADVYVDTISHEAVAALLKKKIETRIGGASKTIAFKDEKLFAFISEIVKHFEFNGPIDMDFFYRDGVYYLSEVNPRFGGGYLHTFGAGVDFPKYIRNNIHGRVNQPEMGNYEEGSIMIMYDEVIMVNEKDLKGDYRD